MGTLKLAGLAAVLLGSITATSASAMPVAPLPSDAATNIEQVRWVCGPYRCWWRPNYYRSYGYGYRPYGFYPRRAWGGGWRHRHGRRW